jgi:hypothetical protein
MSEGDCTGVKARQEGKDQWNFGRRPPSLVISHSLLSLRIFIPSASWLGPTPILSPPLPLSECVYSVAHLSACCETIETGRTVARPKESGACRSLLGGGRRSLRHRPTIQKTRRAGLLNWGLIHNNWRRIRTSQSTPFQSHPLGCQRVCQQNAKCFST